MLATGCAHKTPVSVQSAAPQELPPDPIYAVTVSSNSLDRVAKDVNASHIAPGDKVAFAAMVSQHRSKPQALDGKAVGEMINEERAYQMGLQMVVQSRQREDARRKAMGKLVDVKVISERDESLRTTLTFVVQNKTAKPIEGIETGMYVYNLKGARVGMGDLDIEHDIPPGATQRFPMRLSYLKFGEDAGSMRINAGKPKTINLKIKVVKYKDGTEAGSDE